MSDESRIVRNANIMGGRPVIRGTRVTVRTIAASLAAGDSIEELLEAFPSLTEEDIRAVMASMSASESEQ